MVDAVYPANDGFERVGKDQLIVQGRGEPGAHLVHIRIQRPGVCRIEDGKGNDSVVRAFYVDVESGECDFGFCNFISFICMFYNMPIAEMGKLDSVFMVGGLQVQMTQAYPPNPGPRRTQANEECCEKEDEDGVFGEYTC